MITQISEWALELSCGWYLCSLCEIPLISTDDVCCINAIRRVVRSHIDLCELHENVTETLPKVVRDHRHTR